MPPIPSIVARVTQASPLKQQSPTPCMNPLVNRFGRWSIESLPLDGGRICYLAYDDLVLLTTAPTEFHSPIKDYGKYETRPVFGYDDCWPSVSSCKFPGSSWLIPDHGELCWLPWEVSQRPTGVLFRVESMRLPATFERELEFCGNSLTWHFRITNSGPLPLPCQHVMHPLLPLRSISSMVLPNFESVSNATKARELIFCKPAEVADFLISQRPGTAIMLYLHNIREGRLVLGLTGGTDLTISFPVSTFRSLGIWWNNLGYPDEHGCHRSECAFEPIPGSTSHLDCEYKERSCLFIQPETTYSWDCQWQIAI